MLTLPTHLTLDHLFNKQRKVKPHIQKPHLQHPIEQDESKQIQSILKMTTSYDEQQCYDSQFVRIFMLIKLNALLAKQCNINQQFISAMVELYNSGKALVVYKSKSDDELFAQIMLEGQLHRHIKIQDVQNVLAGQCLLATSLAIIIKQTQTFLNKAQLTFALSFLALSGRPQAFVPIVHKEKNHFGQMKFAGIIESYIKINNPEKYLRIQIQSKVQDPYSMRCSPQVYGVVYECLEFVKKDFDCILNKLHFRKINIDGQEFDNIDLSADTEVLKGDFLVCSLNEIGSMAFLRSERILNIYLGKNQVHKQNPKYVFQLKQVMQKTVHLVADNKLLCAPSNGDTMNIDNYQRDIYFTPYKVYQKFTKMISNLYKIMLLEVETALLGLDNIYNIGEGEIFQNNTVKENYFRLESNCIGSGRKQALFFVKNNWEVYGEANSQ